MTNSAVVDMTDAEAFRRELMGYCYRMLGSAHDAEDAVQETMLKAFRGGESFRQESSLRTWLYRIATNVSLDMLRARGRRAAPTELGMLREPVADHLGETLAPGSSVLPIADDRVLPEASDPADFVLARESVRLAFVAALQHLPPKQRAVLILREVLAWRADEVAALLETTVASVNSALQRARATMAGVSILDVPPLDGDQEQVLRRYVDAFERYDIDAFVGLLHDDAIQSMPPFAMWLRGADDIGVWMLGPGSGCRGSRLLTTSANGTSAAAQYRPDPDGGWAPWALHVLDIDGGRIREIHTFLTTDETFPLFGFPHHLE